MLNKKSVYRRYKNGESVISISKDCGVSRERIYQVIRKNIALRRNAPLLSDSGKVTKNSYSHRRSKTPLKGAELYVFNKLIKNGVKMKESCSIFYDLETAKGTKIEVKHRTKKSIRNGYYKINVPNKNLVDYVVIVIGNLNSPTTYIVKSKYCPESLSIPEIRKNNSRKKIYKHIDDWGYIKS